MSAVRLSYSPSLTHRPPQPTDWNPGNLKSLNELAQKAGAHYIIHTGDFGFYDEESLKRIADK